MVSLQSEKRVSCQVTMDIGVTGIDISSTVMMHVPKLRHEQRSEVPELAAASCNRFYTAVAHQQRPNHTTEARRSISKFCRCNRRQLGRRNVFSALFAAAATASSLAPRPFWKSEPKSQNIDITNEAGRQPSEFAEAGGVPDITWPVLRLAPATVQDPSPKTDMDKPEHLTRSTKANRHQTTLTEVERGQHWHETCDTSTS